MSTSVRIVFGLIFALSLMLVPIVRADDWNQASKLTFNQPFEIPGHKILAAGTYWFETMSDDSSADKNLVRILTADRTKVYAVLTTSSIERMRPTGTTQITLAESNGGEPNAIVSWFYPGRTSGHEFIYDTQEKKTVTHEPVLKVMAQPETRAYGD